MSYREVLEALAPLASVANVLVRFGTNPVGFVASIISLYIVNTVVNIGAYAVNVILAAFDIVTGALNVVRGGLSWALGGVGDQIIGAILSGRAQVVDVVGGAGPAGPIIAAVVAAVGLYVLYRLGVALLGEIPIGSTIVDLLGLR